MNKRLKKTFLTAALGGLIATSAAHGAPHGGDKGERGARFLEEYDANQDRAVSAEELEAGRSARLKEFDADADGKLSLKEFEALWLARMRERMVDAFQRLDADGDANVTASEFARPSDRRFMWIDRNADGQVTMNEMRAGRHARGERGRKGRCHSGGRGHAQ